MYLDPPSCSTYHEPRPYHVFRSLPTWWICNEHFPGSFGGPHSRARWWRQGLQRPVRVLLRYSGKERERLNLCGLFSITLSTTESALAPLHCACEWSCCALVHLALLYRHLQRSPEGLYVCMRTFLGLGRDYIELHARKTHNTIFLHIRRTKKQPPQVSQCHSVYAPTEARPRLGGVPYLFYLYINWR